MQHVVTSTAMFVIAFIVSSAQQPQAEPARSRRLNAPRLAWFTGIALLLGALVWSTESYVAHVASCAHLRLTAGAIPLARPRIPPPPSPEYLDMSALGIEAILLMAFVFFAIRAVRRRRRARRIVR